MSSFGDDIICRTIVTNDLKGTSEASVIFDGTGSFKTDFLEARQILYTDDVHNLGNQPMIKFQNVNGTYRYVLTQLPTQTSDPGIVGGLFVDENGFVKIKKS